MGLNEFSDFDIDALHRTLEAKRKAEGLTEKQMMDAINKTNNQLHLIPMSLGTIKNMVKRNETTCQHVLHLCRWLDKSPEDFLTEYKGKSHKIPFTKKGRFYWSMKKLATLVNEKKEQLGLSWKQIAQELNCSQNQVSGLHKRTYGISIHLAMRITQWLGKFSADFIVDVEKKS